MEGRRKSVIRKTPGPVKRTPGPRRKPLVTITNSQPVAKPSLELDQPLVGDSVSRLLHSAHSTFSNMLPQVDAVVLKAHTLSVAMKITDEEVEQLSRDLMSMVSTLQRWQNFFVEAANRPAAKSSCSEDTEKQPQNTVATLNPADLIPLTEEEEEKVWEIFSSLSDSPLLLGFNKEDQFFLLTPARARTIEPMANLSHPPPSFIKEASAQQENRTKLEQEDAKAFLPVEETPLIRKRATVDPLPEAANASSSQAMEEMTPLCRNLVATPRHVGSSCRLRLPPKSPFSMEIATPRPLLQSLLKKYPRILNPDDAVPCSSHMETPMVLATPRIAFSPPRTCVLMRPSPPQEVTCNKTTEPSLDSPVIILGSPFRTPGIFLRSAIIKEEKTSVSPVPSDGKEVGSTEKPSPCPYQPGEQTLKKELWSKLEIERAAFGDVCKSLFPESSSNSMDDSQQYSSHKNPSSILKTRFKGLRCQFR